MTNEGPQNFKPKTPEEEWQEKWPNAKETILTPDFQEKYPLISSKITDNGSAQILLATAEFARVDPELLAGIIEKDILSPLINDNKLSFEWRDPSDTVWGQRNTTPEYDVLMVVSFYTQEAPFLFRKVFLTQDNIEPRGWGDGKYSFLDFKTTDKTGDTSK